MRKKIVCFSISQDVKEALIMTTKALGKSESAYVDDILRVDLLPIPEYIKHIRTLQERLRKKIEEGL